MRIAMWSGPRNLSTAMMYSFGSRSDFAVWDEPFYAAYLAATGIDHPMRAEILAAGEVDPVRVARLVIRRCHVDTVTWRLAVEAQGNSRTHPYAGERTDPDTLKWAEDMLKVPVIDHWWQTETGWSIAANPMGLELLPVKIFQLL